MNAGRNYGKARKHAQVNANFVQQPRYLHLYNGVWWIDKTPCEGSIQIDPCKEKSE